jgi:hypothetical protein
MRVVGHIGEYTPCKVSLGNIEDYTLTVNPVPFIMNVDKTTATNCEELTFSTPTTSLFVFWDFGKDASPATAIGKGPNKVTYLTLGDKTANLSVNNSIKTKSIKIVDCSITGIAGSNKMRFQIYPNPTTNSVHITGESIDKITLLNLKGEILKTYTISGNELEIDLSSQPSGMYFIKILSGDKQEIKQVVKN